MSRGTWEKNVDKWIEANAVGHNEKKGNYKQCINKYKMVQVSDVPRGHRGWAEGERLIGKCFLRAVTAEQVLKEVMGMNWLRGAGRKFGMERKSQSEEGRNQAVRREGTMGHFASNRKTEWKLTRPPFGEVWRGNVGQGSREWEFTKDLEC